MGHENKGNDHQRKHILMFKQSFPTTVESRFFEYSIIRNSRFFEPKVVSLGFASVKHCNFTPDFSNARFLETPDISNKFFLPFKNLHSISRTLENSGTNKNQF